MPVNSERTPALMAAFPVDREGAARLLPGGELHPVRLPGGRGLLVVTVVNYEVTDIGKYVEYSLAIACTFVSWTPAKVLVTLSMVVSGSVIFFAVFIGFACIQFWTIDANEVANAFTYGGNTMTQYPLTVFPSEVVKGLTVLIPLAFVNWYPALYVLDKPDPFGYPDWLQFASPVVAAIMMAGALLVWRTGVRHYTSTGS